MKSSFSNKRQTWKVNEWLEFDDTVDFWLDINLVHIRLKLLETMTADVLIFSLLFSEVLCCVLHINVVYFWLYNCLNKIGKFWRLNQEAIGILYLMSNQILKNQPWNEQIEASRWELGNLKWFLKLLSD